MRVATFSIFNKDDLHLRSRQQQLHAPNNQLQYLAHLYPMILKLGSEIQERKQSQIGRIDQ